jgi:hypothetical protein
MKLGEMVNALRKGDDLKVQAQYGHSIPVYLRPGGRGLLECGEEGFFEIVEHGSPLCFHA